MEKEIEKFLQAEEVAFRLVETLKQLHTEATSYQNATKELETIRHQLIELIAVMQKVANASYEAIKTLKEIGTPEILSRLSQLLNGQSRIDERSVRILDFLPQMQGVIQEIQITLSKFENRSTQFLNELSKKIDDRSAHLENNLSAMENTLSKKMEEKSIRLENNLSAMENKISSHLESQSKLLNRFKTLITMTLTLSIFSTIFGLISLLK